ncbi:hypothetical protein [Stenotrophomonas mori]|uniref:Uncharacterized protein n=1 Tax=Stenotrophomonas mori TaxID=2871096 RepID=A0ABT0SFI5_9GAMM|nr:hypothetical protein [Stenotrophomonas mori]MCL7713871.1 hypothetical protein [Stenotrophomonas mori]
MTGRPPILCVRGAVEGNHGHRLFQRDRCWRHRKHYPGLECADRQPVPAQAPAQGNPGADDVGRGVRLGRGLAEFTYGESRFLGHAGDAPGSHSRVIYNPEDRGAIAYSTTDDRIPTNAFLETLVGIVYGGGFTLSGSRLLSARHFTTRFDAAVVSMGIVAV